VPGTTAARRRAAASRRGSISPSTLKRWTGWSSATLLLLLFAVFFDVPLMWLLLAITKTGNALTQQNPLSFGSLHQLQANWHQLMRAQDGAFKTWVFNSAQYSVLAVAITLAVSIPAGYGLATSKFKGRRVLLAVTLVGMLMPSTVLVLPLFLEMNSAGLVNTTWSVVLPYSYYPFGVYLAYIYFASHLSGSMLEAARIDGASEFQVFSRIALPLAAPIVALIGFFSFVQDWNNYYLPFVMLDSSDKYPLQLGLSTFRGSSSVTALAVVVAVAPVLVVFVFSQRFLVAGLNAGGTKG
jgi:multiple sugar transport system permease protein